MKKQTSPYIIYIHIETKSALVYQTNIRLATNSILIRHNPIAEMHTLYYYKIGFVLGTLRLCSNEPVHRRTVTKWSNPWDNHGPSRTSASAPRVDTLVLHASLVSPLFSNVSCLRCRMCANKLTIRPIRTLGNRADLYTFGNC